jgi:putative transposase
MWLSVQAITADYNDMIYAATREEVGVGARPLFANGGSSIAPPRTAAISFTRLTPSQWRSACTSNAIEHLHAKSRIKTPTALPSAETTAMLFWALSSRSDQPAQS